jgi:hypothetical protein
MRKSKFTEEQIHHRQGAESLSADELICDEIHTPLLSAARRSRRLHAELARALLPPDFSSQIELQQLVERLTELK